MRIFSIAIFRGRRNPLRPLANLLALMLAFAGSAHSATFTPLGDLPGGHFFSAAYAISADGTTVVGSSTTENQQVRAFRWTAAAGITPLAPLSRDARGVSGDGSFAVGQSASLAARWDTAGGELMLGDLPGGSTNSFAWAISGDGMTIVGSGTSAAGGEAFRWRNNEGMVGLGDLPGGGFSSTAFGISADGNTIVGSSSSTLGREAFIWQSSNGMQSLGDLAGGLTNSYARDVSADGSVVVGFGSNSTSQSVAWIWDTAHGMRALPFVFGGAPSSSAWAVSDDGSIAIGSNNGQAFIWDAQNGTQSLHALLFGLGVDVTGWFLTEATGVSADGRSIVGYGINPSGATEAFLAYIPEPIEERNIDDPNTATYRKTDGSTVNPIRDRIGLAYSFSGPNLTPGVSWTNAILSGTDLIQAALRGAHLPSASLYESWLSGGDLSYAQLPDANLRRTRLDGTNLNSANLIRADLSEVDARLANLENANLDGANLRDSNLSAADLTQATFRGADLSGANLSDASLFEAQLSQAILISTDMRDADLYHANLYQADLTGADLSRADLFGASLQQANLTDTILTGAYYGQTTFPVGFDPIAAGMVTGPRVINNGLAPPNPDNVVNRPDIDLIINNAGCNALLAYPCLSPGAPTTVTGHGYDVRVYESSVFTGDASNLTALDTSQVTANVYDGVQVSGSASAIVTGYDEASAQVFGSSFAELRGSFDPVSIYGHSHVLFNASTGEANDLSVAGDAYLEFRGYSTALSAAGGTTVIDGGETQLLYVGPESQVSLERGVIGDRAYNMWGLVNVLGDFEMRGGTIRDSTIYVSGRAVLIAGRISADSADPEYISAIGPWSLIARASGSIDIRGGLIDPFIKLAARDTSTIRIFGTTFSVDGSDVPYGRLVAAQGVLSGSLASGDSISNAYAQKGANCGGIPCDGKIVVLLDGDDWDADGVPNVSDNCPDEPNSGQEDSDSDGFADACNSSIDRDGDEWADTLDNCQYDANPAQTDTDGDGIGDYCDSPLTFWSDRGPSGCFEPPSGELFAPVTTDLGNWEAISRDEQPCDCFGIELSLPFGAASIKFRHVAPDSTLSEYCENSPPYALGLAVGQRICSNELAQNGLHTLTATPYSAAGCQYGGGVPLPTSERKFWIAAPEPGFSSTLALGIAGIAIASRKRSTSSKRFRSSASHRFH
jgi:probable HAF family extracellular repeat protein